MPTTAEITAMTATTDVATTVFRADRCPLPSESTRRGSTTAEVLSAAVASGSMLVIEVMISP
jgi:hypothetical protein